jgi:methyl-accepting chemotaxis protein
MAKESDSQSNVVTRGLGALRDAVTGGSDDAEQAQTEAAAETEPDDGSGSETDGPSAPSERTAEAYADTMEQCAAGDLTVRMEATGDDEAMDRVATGFNEMVSELEQSTDHLKSYVGEVEGAGVGIERSAETVQRASDDVVDSMQTISTDMGEQRAQLQETAAAIDEVTAALQQFAVNHPDADIDPQITRLEAQISELRDAASASQAVQSETKVVSAAVEEQAAELSDVSRRADDLQRYAKPLSAILDRFETDSEQESVASVGDD